MQITNPKFDSNYNFEIMIKQDSTLSNIKNMQKQQRLFTLIHLINSRKEGRQIINIILIVISTLANLINFMSLKQIGILNTHIFVLNHAINMILLPLFALIILQLIIGFFYQLEFFLSIQWKVYRFMLYPFVMSYLLDQGVYGTLFNPTLAIVLFGILFALSLILTALFCTESYVYKKLLHRDLPINFYLLVVETLLYLSAVIENKNIEITAALMLTILSYNIYYNNFSVMKENCLEYRFLCVQTFALLWSGLIFTVALFTEAKNIESLIVASIPCLLYKLISDFSREQYPLSYQAFTQIFEDPDAIHFQEFISSLQPTIEEIMEYYYSQNKKDFVETLLISFYYEHSNRCMNLNCPFKNQDYKFELRNMNDSKNMKEVLFKICKKIDYAYYGMYKTWPQHIDLKLSLVQFYIFCFPNKIRALEIISEIQLSKLTFQQQYELFRVKILCQNMNSLQVAGQIKLDQRLLQFENLVYLTLNTMMEFWSLFYEEKIDFNKLTSITTKIFPLRNKIEEIFQERLNQQTFSTLQVLKLYSMYCAAIETNQEKSWKINDYLDKLKSKLQQHKEIQYLSFDSDIGLIALSLSQSKLGNIAMVNSQASAIFNYTKKDFKNMKANQIMPKIFAEQHDNYLKVFLQNRTKKINSDERKLFGKNKAGYIFPILLQLQRTVSSTGDQLLFIANIKKQRINQASITCVTDEEGQICDYSSTFDYFFLKQEKLEKNKKHIQKNIQEYIPEFFDSSVEEDENTHTKSFKQMITLKSYGKIQIEYIVTPVAFPLKQNGGYIVEGNVINSDRPLLFPHLSMTESLRTMMNRQILSAHKTYYNHQTNRYQLSKEQEPLNINDQYNKQFTIPFININDVTDIFGMKKEVPVYGQNVKTIRLVGDHFQRVEDQSEFMSEMEQDITQSAQNINKVMELKESIMKQKKPAFMRNIKLLLFLLSLGCVLVFILLISQYNDYYNANVNRMEEIKYKFKTRGYLSEYIIYFTALQQGFNPQEYQGYLTETREELINAIEQSNILETRKENILKIAYLQDQANLTNILQLISQQFPLSSINTSQTIMTSWLVFFIILVILIIVTAFNYCLFMKQLQSVYQVFMSLEEKIIKKLHFECKKIAKLIEKGNQKDRDDSNINSEYSKANDIKNTEDNEEDNENPVKKIRKFKDEEKFRNLILLIKLVMPFGLIILVSIFNLIELYNQNTHIQYEASIHKQIFQVIPETSVQLMNTLIKNTNHYQVTNSENYVQTYQNIDKVILEYQKEFASHIEESFFELLLGNVCENKIFTAERSDFCKSLIENTLTVGLSKAINYLANSMARLQNTGINGTLSDKFSELIVLEYQFIFPIVEHMTQVINDQLKEQFSDFTNKFSTLAILMIVLIGINYLYFCQYPAYEIEEKIQLSKGLIDLLPEYYKNQQKPNNEGYLEVKELE